MVGDGRVTSFFGFLYETVAIAKFGDKTGHGDIYHWQIWY